MHNIPNFDSVTDKNENIEVSPSNSQNTEKRVAFPASDLLRQLSNNLSVKAPEQETTQQEQWVASTSTKQYPGSNEDSEFEPNSKKRSTFPEWTKKSQYCPGIIYPGASTVFEPEVILDEKCSKNFDKVFNEKFKENLASGLFETDTEIDVQKAIEESCKSPNPEPRTDSIALKSTDDTSVFKIPKTPTRRKKRLSGVLSKSANKQQEIKKFEDSENEAAKNVIQKRNKSLKSNSSMKRNETNIVSKNKFDENILCKFPDLSKFCFSNQFLEPKSLECSGFGSDCEDTARHPSNTEKVSHSRSDISNTSGSRNDVGDRSRNGSGEGTQVDSGERFQNDSGERYQNCSGLGPHTVKRSRNDTGEKSWSYTGENSRSYTGEKSRNDTGEKSQFHFDTATPTRSQIVSEGVFPIRNDTNPAYLSDDLISLIKGLENIVTNGLVLLENYIHYWHCMPCAGTSWLPKLTSVLPDLARRRPCSEIRERFIDILATMGYGVIKIFNDFRIIFCNGNIREDQSLIPDILKFWEKTEKVYTDLGNEFYKTREDYHNFFELWTIMGEHYMKVKEIFFELHDCIIDIYESF